MNLEQFLEKRLTKEEGKKDNKLIITLPNEILNMIDNDDRGKKILKDNVVKFIRELKRDLEA